jgi:ribosome biogenesis GTPase / thiamine phosphate phosphatase
VPDPGQLVQYGWTTDISENLPHGCTPARITRVDRGWCDAVTPGEQLRVSSGSFDLCTGDWVTVADRAVVHLLPRRTAIMRAAASGRSEPQPLAANVDTVGIVMALDGDIDLGRIERMLALAWESGAQPVVILTKSDAARHVADAVASVHAIAHGCAVVAISAVTGDALDILTATLNGTTVLIGPSGAGKSTLANALIGADVLATNIVRTVDGKGRHTTVHRELFPLPSVGALIDTPGLRSIGLWDAGEGIERVFRDIDSLAELCRFGDCRHVAEPGCAVLAAVESGELPARRLASYRKLLRENEWVASRSDARLAIERARSWKAISKAQRKLHQHEQHRR